MTRESEQRFWIVKAVKTAGPAKVSVHTWQPGEDLSVLFGGREKFLLVEIIL